MRSILLHGDMISLEMVWMPGPESSASGLRVHCWLLHPIQDLDQAFFFDRSRFSWE